ncbi:STM3941 family protein [Ktedonobacter racemifer]|uniref:Uncharacterized protein n=1 Tax=Ktedonobacter racemifer DSM 44963 TaxID=485913 RepID=D6U2B1_KTERA|nr:STM3941 family protein [Ktedonobacter racemifer]EFH82779.1 hypothetical protein Krac_3629 [Ktedonobacter racemifer DSM 44963]
MQVFQDEIVIPLITVQDQPTPKFIRSRLFWIALVFGIGFFSVRIFLRLAADTQEMMFDIWGLVFLLLMCGALLTQLIRKLRSHSSYLHINHKGIFTSRDSFLIRWAEIKALSPSTFMGSPFLMIVLWNREEVLSRSKVALNPFTRFTLFRYLNSSLPFGFSQRILPISIDELLTTIQERFATELREHSIAIGDWEHQASIDA